MSCWTVPTIARYVSVWLVRSHHLHCSRSIHHCFLLITLWYSDCWLWHVPCCVKWPLLHNIRRQDSCQVDSPWSEEDAIVVYMIMANDNWPEFVRWSPPFPLQALLQRKYSSSSDVWSYGMVMFEIWSVGCTPFEEKTAVEVSQLLNESKSWFLRTVSVICISVF